MATPLYLQNVAPVNGARGYNDGQWIDAAYAPGSLQTYQIYGLETTRGGGVASLVGGTANGPIVVDLAPSSQPRCWLSRPLAAAVTISGTVTFNIWALESSMSANATLKVKVFRISNTGTVVSTIIDSTRTSATELGTSDAAINWTDTPTSTNMAKGDRIMVVIYATDSSGATLASGFTWTVNYAGTTGGASGDSYVQFNESLTFSTAAPGGSVLYLGDSASPVNVGVDYDEKEMWTARGAGVVSTLMRAVCGQGSPNYAYLWCGDPTTWQACSGTSPSSEGFNLAGTGQSIDDTAGPAWTNPGNITAKDGSVASVFLPGVEYDTLRASNFGFNSVAGKILGDKLKCKGYVSSDLGAGATQQRVYFRDALYQATGAGRLFEFPIGAGSSAEITADDSSGGFKPLDSNSYASTIRGNSSWKTEAYDAAAVQLQQYNIDSVEWQLYYLPWIEWYSKPLVAFTLAGIVRANIQAKWVNAIQTPALGMAVEVAVTNSDGSSPTVFGRQAMAAILTTTEAAYTIDVAGPDISVSDGQRLRFRVMLSNYQRAAPSVSGANANDALLYYAGTSGGASGDSYIILPQTVTEAPTTTELRAPAITFQDPAVM